MSESAPVSQLGTSKLAAVVAAILIAGLMSVTTASAWHAPTDFDEAIYLGIAREITRTGLPMHPREAGSLFLDSPPLALYVAAAGHAVFPESLWAVRTVYTVIWALGVYVMTFLLAQRMFGPRAGICALAVLFTAQHFLHKASMVELDVPLATLATLMLYALVRQGEYDPRSRSFVLWWLWISAVCAAGCLVKYQGVLLPGTAGLFALATFSGRHADSPWTRRLLLPWALVTAGSVLAGVAWWGLSYAAGADFVSRFVWNVGRVSRAPGISAGGIFWLHLARAFGPLLVLGGAAFILAGRRMFTDRRFLLLAVWIGANLVFCSMLSFRYERYFFPAIPALAVLASTVCDRELYRGIKLVRISEAAAMRLATVGVVLVSLAAVRSGLGMLGAFRPDPTNDHYRAAAAAVERVTTPDQRVLLSLTPVAYFADRNYHVSQWAPNADVLVETLSDRDNQIQAVVDSPAFLNPGLPAADRKAFGDAFRAHLDRYFKLDAKIPGKLRVFRRVAWPEPASE